MRFSAFVEFVNAHRKMTMVFALLTTFAGVALVIDRPKGTILEWLAVPCLVVGGAVFTSAMWPNKGSQEGPPSLASRLLRRLTWQGRFTRFFPAFGVAIIFADVGYNLSVSASLSLGTEDTIVLLGAGTLLTHGFFPARLARERDFVLLFFVCLNAILVVPLLASRLYYDDFQRSVDVYSWVALAPQTSAVLAVLGVGNSVHAVAGSTAPGLTFTPQHFGVSVTIVITTACSGIYSFGIFASAFIAFVLTEYQSLSRRTWLLLGMGLLTAYLANVLRMTVIVLVGYYTDTPQSDLQNMLIAHSYAGWLIFLGWIALFWGILFRFMPTQQTPRGGAAARPFAVRRVVSCAICGTILSPAIPALRCRCGSFLHVSCLEGRESCPLCAADVSATSVAPSGETSPDQ